MISSIWQTFKTLVLGGIVVSMAACGPSSRMNGNMSVSDEFKRKLFTEPDQTVSPTVPEKYQTYEVYRVADVQIGANQDASAISARVLISSTAGDETVELVGMVRADGSASLTDIAPLNDGKNRLVAEASCLDKGVCKRIIVNIYFSVAGVTHKKQFASAALLAGDTSAEGSGAGAGSGADAKDAKAPTATEEIKPESQKSGDQAEGDDHEDDVHDSEKELADETDESDRTLGEFAGPTRNEALIGKLFPRTEVPSVLPPQEKEAAPQPSSRDKTATDKTGSPTGAPPAPSNKNPAPTGNRAAPNGQTSPSKNGTPSAGASNGKQPPAQSTRPTGSQGKRPNPGQPNSTHRNRGAQTNGAKPTDANTRTSGNRARPTAGAQTTTTTRAQGSPPTKKDERSTLERARDWVVSWFKTEEPAKPAPKPKPMPQPTATPKPKQTSASTANRGSTQQTATAVGRGGRQTPPAVNQSTKPAQTARPAQAGRAGTRSTTPTTPVRSTVPTPDRPTTPTQQNTNPSGVTPAAPSSSAPRPTTPSSNTPSNTQSQPPAPTRTAAPAPTRTAVPAPTRTAAPAAERSPAPEPERTAAPASAARSQYPFPPATPSPDDDEAEQQIAAHEMKWAPLMNLRDGGVAEGSYSGAGRPAARIRNASQLPDSGRGLNAIRINAGAHFGTGMLVSFLQNAASYLFRELGLSLFVGDMSIRNGGRFGRSHQTHKNGLDADIAYLAINSPLRDSALDARGRIVENFNFEATWTFLKLAYRQEFVSDAKRVSAISRVFMSHKVKDGFCAWAKRENLLEDEKNVELLRLIRRERGHHKHFHLSLKCSPYYSSCRNLAGPPPVGAGCP